MKRAFDFSLALIGLIVLAPFLLMLAVSIKMADRGPLFYGQKRIGFNGNPFTMWKFRSMRVGADRNGPLVTVAGDTRITAIGRFLRKTKLDELPQLWNVLRGDMSLVGPRPEVEMYVALYSPAQRAVLALRPGVTDPASFAFFDESEILARASSPEEFYRQVLMPEKIRINLEYAARASFSTDALMVLATVFKAFGVQVDIFSRLGIERPKIERLA